MPISTLQPVPNCLKPFLPHFWSQKESIEIEYQQDATFPACAIIVIVVVIMVIVIVVVVEDEEDGDVTTRCHLPSLCHRLVGNLWSD